jgi:hypothetical protein
MITAKVRVTAQTLPREAGYFGFLGTIIVIIWRPPVELWHMRVPLALRNRSAIISGRIGCG